MRKIGIDARFITGARRGIGNYVYALLENILLIDKNNQYYIYVDKDDAICNKFKSYKNVTLRVVHGNYLIWEQVYLPYYLKRDEIDVFHSTGNTAPIFIPNNVKLVVTIHDVMYLVSDYRIMPKTKKIYQRIGRIYRRLIVPIIARRATRIITISNFSKTDIIKYICPEISKNISVIYEAGTLTITAKQSKVSKDRYILALGAVDPRKNTRRIIMAFNKMKEKGEKLKLLLCGIEQREGRSLIDGVSDEVVNDIEFLGYVSDDMLCDLYRNAEAFVYVSLYEGFGFPVLDAMKCETPIIASDITSIPEIVGDAGILVNPYDVNEISMAIYKVINNKEMKYDLIKKGNKRKELYSWYKNAKETIQIYEEV